MKAVLTAVSQGSLDAATAVSIMEQGQGQATNLPVTPPSPIQVNNTHDNDSDNSNDDDELVVMTVGDEIRLERNERPTRHHEILLDDAQIVSPAAEIAAMNRTKTGKNNTTNNNKRTAAAGGMMASASRKKPRSDGLAKLMKGARVAALGSGLEDYNARQVEALLKEIMRKRLPVTAIGEDNPLRVDKGSVTVKTWSTRKKQLRRLLNFVTSVCITEEEFKCWSSGLPVLEADAPQDVTDERHKRTDAIAKALAGRCITWWKKRATPAKNGEYRVCLAGSLQSHIDKLTEKEKKAYDDMNQINNKRRMNATEAAAAAAAAVEEEAEEE